MRTFLRMLAVVAVLMLSAGAMAQSSSNAQLSNFRWELTDLDVNDGVDPSLTFMPMELGRHASIRWNYIDYHTGMARSDLAWGGGFPEVVAAAGPSFTDEPHLRIDLIGSIIGTSFENAVISASANGLDRVGQMFGNILSLSDGINFILSPNTGVSFFADASVHSSAGFEAGPGYIAVGNSFVRMWFSPDRSNWSSSVLEHIAEYGQDNGSGFDQALQMDYANLGGSTAHLTLQLEAIAAVSSALAPIPEPQTYLMLLIGLGVVLRMRSPAKSRRPG